MQVADLFASLGLKVDEGSWKRGDQLIGGIKKGLAFFAGFEAVKGIGEAVKSVVDLGSSLNDTAQKTGLSVEALQEYGYIAKLNSSSTDDFSRAVVKLSRGLDEVATKGSGPAYDALTRLKINVTDPKWKASTLDEKITLIAQKLNTLPDGVKKTALAMDLFGKSGADLIPTLNQIAEEGADTRAEFRELGDELSTKQAADLDTLGDNLDKTKVALSGLKTQVVVALLPTLKEMVDGLLAWVKANREVIASGIHAVVEGLVIAFKALGAVVSVIVDVIAFFNEHAMLARSLLIALGIVIGAVAAEAAAAWIIGFAPVIAVVAAITAVILVFQDLLRAVLDGKGVIASAVHWIVDKFKAIPEGIMSAVRAVGDFFESIADSIKGAFVVVFDWIKDKVEWAWDQVKKIANYVSHPWEIVSDAVDYFTGDEPAKSGVSSPMQAPLLGGAQAQTAQASRYISDLGNTADQTTNVHVDTPTTNVTINANGVKADEVVKIAKDQIQQQHDKVWRETQAATTDDEDD